VRLSCLFVLLCSNTLFNWIAQAQTPATPPIIRCEEDVTCTHQFVDGQKFKILTTDGAVIAVALRSNGHYVRADISVTNLAQRTVDVLPSEMTLQMDSPKSKVLAFVSPEQIAKSAEHRAGWANALNSMGAGMATQQATTQTSSSGSVNGSGTVNSTNSDGTYSNGTYNTNGTYSGSSTSTTSSPDYAAQARARQQISERRAAVAALETNLAQTTLRANTVMSGKTVRGYVYFQCDKHADTLHLTIPIAGTMYVFPFKMMKQ